MISSMRWSLWKVPSKAVLGMRATYSFRHVHHFTSVTPTSRPAPPPRQPPQRNGIVPVNGLSSVSGLNSPPLLDQTLGQFFNQLVQLYPTSMALISRHESPRAHQLDYIGGDHGEDCLRWDYKTFERNIDALARGLLKLGVKKGDRIGVYLGNGSAYALLQWTTAKLGAILVSINPASRGPELLAALNLSGCRMLFITPTLRRNQHIPMLNELLPSLATSNNHELADPACPSLKSIVIVDNTGKGATEFEKGLQQESLGGHDFRRLFDWEGEGLHGAEVSDCHDVINLQFTSGTTGKPKAVSLTHHNLLNNGFLIGECMALRPPSLSMGWKGESLVNTPPLFHCFGIVSGALATWTHAGCLIFASELFDPIAALRAVVIEKSTMLHGVPTMFIAELALLDDMDNGKIVPGLSELKEMDFSNLRTGIAAGSPVPDEVMRRLVKRMNLRDLTITYGMTETSPATVMSSTTDSLALRCTTVGRVLPHTHVRIVDPHHPLYPSSTMPSVPVGVAGELWSAGYALQKGYWNNQEETDKCMFSDEEGVRWIMTGDQALMDKDGYISIVGRIKDIIIRGGENLFPVVIENRALMLEGIADCSIIAVPDPIMGEVVGAFVQRDQSLHGKALTPAIIRSHISKLLSHQSAPDWVWFLSENGVGGEYPKTASGKIRKVELREWADVLVKRGVGNARE